MFSILFVTLFFNFTAQQATAQPIEEKIEQQRAMVFGVIKIGDTHRAQGNLDKALEAYGDVVAIGKLWNETRPDDVGWQRVLLVGSGRVCNVLLEKRQHDTALRACEKYRAVAQYLLDADPTSTEWQRGLANAHQRIGDAQWGKAKSGTSEKDDDVSGDTDDGRAARKSFSESLAIGKRLAKADPENTKLQRDLYWAYSRVGGAQLRKDNGAALNAYLDALTVAERGARADPDDSDWQIAIFGAQTWIGYVHTLIASEDKRWGGHHLRVALESYLDALDTAEQLAKTDPKNAVSARLLDRPLSMISILAGVPVLVAEFEKDAARGDHSRALKAFDVALAESERQAKNDKNDPGKAYWQGRVSFFYRKIGDVLETKGLSGAALDAYRDSVAAAEPLVRGEFGMTTQRGSVVTDNAMPSWQRDLAEGYTKIAAVLVKQGQRREAREPLQKARALVLDLKTVSSPKSLRIPELDKEITKLERKLSSQPKSKPDQNVQN